MPGDSFISNVFSGTKKGRGSDTGNQFEKSKCFFEVRIFQNGRDSFVKRSSSEGRLVGEDRSDRCLFDSVDNIPRRHFYNEYQLFCLH